jgi:hypothetical protein
MTKKTKAQVKMQAPAKTKAPLKRLNGDKASHGRSRAVKAVAQAPIAPAAKLQSMVKPVAAKAAAAATASSPPTISIDSIFSPSDNRTRLGSLIGSLQIWLYHREIDHG